jgi:hypothetical protein
MFEGNLADLLIVESGNGNVYFVEDQASKKIEARKEIFEEKIQNEEEDLFHELK